MHAVWQKHHTCIEWCKSISRASSVARAREHQGVLGADVRNSDAGGGGPGPGGVGHMREGGGGNMAQGGRELSPRYMREGGRELMREGGREGMREGMREGGRELSPRYLPLAPGSHF
jgi:hypothetical protein